MAKSNTGQIVIIGAIGLAAVYLLTRRGQTTSPPLPYSAPTTQQQQQQLLQWANTQSAATTIANIIGGLDWQGIADMWGKIFGGSNHEDYSGGGTDSTTNPYQEYDPYNYNNGEYWV